MFLVKYPNSSTKIGRLNAEHVHSILISEETVLDHIGMSDEALHQWNTGEWTNNPSIIVRSALNGINNCGFYCQHAGHLNATHVTDLSQIQHKTSSTTN
ncbi:hypothetical protein Enr17x_04800 [Gimesia fumaroli]|uniref:Uncharacterized protein n=1 Tax=Gimesia fumaroli TaxID=2527976 RepID=A0A518I5Y2_9PLAN|nr:hypothetical protein Enr17x_04800 [Gimesia fumaroli]